eukprot:763908-Hanusia_phi.AAC.2
MAVVRALTISLKEERTLSDGEVREQKRRWMKDLGGGRRREEEEERRRRRRRQPEQFDDSEYPEQPQETHGREGVDDDRGDGDEDDEEVEEVPAVHEEGLEPGAEEVDQELQGEHRGEEYLQVGQHFVRLTSFLRQGLSLHDGSSEGAADDEGEETLYVERAVGSLDMQPEASKAAAALQPLLPPLRLVNLGTQLVDPLVASTLVLCPQAVHTPSVVSPGDSYEVEGLSVGVVRGRGRGLPQALSADGCKINHFSLCLHKLDVCDLMQRYEVEHNVLSRFAQDEVRVSEHRHPRLPCLPLPTAKKFFYYDLPSWALAGLKFPGLIELRIELILKQLTVGSRTCWRWARWHRARSNAQADELSIADPINRRGTWECKRG